MSTKQIAFMAVILVFNVALIMSDDLWSHRTLIGIDIGSVIARAAVYNENKLHLIGTFEVEVISSFDKGFCSSEDMDDSVTSCSVSYVFNYESLFSTIKKSTEEYLKESVHGAVLSVPMHFSNTHKLQLIEAGLKSNLHIERIVTQGVAALHGFDLVGKERESTVLAFDFGGTSLDISIISTDNNVYETLSNTTSTAFTCNMVNDMLIPYFSNLVYQSKGVKFRRDQNAMKVLKREIEQVKRSLSSERTVLMELSLHSPTPLHFTYDISREEFEHVISDYIQQSVMMIDKTLELASLNKNQIDEILVVGGCGKMPIVHKIIKKYFNGKEPLTKVNTTRTIGMMATTTAVTTKVITTSDENPLISDVNTDTITESVIYEPIISSGPTVVPADEAVVYGAAKYAYYLANYNPENDILMTKILSLSLGIELENGMFMKVLHRNTILPVMKSVTIGTAHDDQKNVMLRVYQGEHNIADMNHYLGTLLFKGLSPRPRGSHQIQVVFDSDKYGNLKVSMNTTYVRTGEELYEYLEWTHSEMLHDDEECEKRVRDAEIAKTNINESDNISRRFVVDGDDGGSVVIYDSDYIEETNTLMETSPVTPANSSNGNGVMTTPLGTYSETKERRRASAAMLERSTPVCTECLIESMVDLSIGIETVGGVMTTILPRHLWLPNKKVVMFSTVRDDQDTVHVHVYHGERVLTEDNYYLGTVEITNIPRMVRGEPQIEVTMVMDVQGVLTVLVVEKLSGMHNELVILVHERITDHVIIGEIVSEANRNAASDLDRLNTVYLNLLTTADRNDVSSAIEKVLLPNKLKVSL